MSRRHPPKRGRCQKCRKRGRVIYFRKKYICSECLNPPEDLSIEDFIPSPSSILGDAELFAPGSIGKLTPAKEGEFQHDD